MRIKENSNANLLAHNIDTGSYVIPYYVVVPARVLALCSDPPRYSEPSKVKEVEETTYLVPIEMTSQADSAQT